MEPFLIRATNLADAPAVEGVLGASYPALMASAYEPAVLGPVLGLITKANPALLASGDYYLAEMQNGRAAGCGGWTRECPPGFGEASVSRGHLRHFATHPDWIGLGIGRAIYDRRKAAAKVDGVAELEVLSSLNAEGFYSALGFSRVREVVVTIAGHAFPSVLMFQDIGE